jgi:hypothetical protein
MGASGRYRWAPYPTFEECPLTARKLVLSLCTTAVVAAFATPAHASPPVHSDVAVCNEAENSWQGGYVVTDGPVDPNPPARLRGSQMKVGNGKGLVNAAEHSPALRVCGPEDDQGGGGGDDGGGGIS